MTDTGLAADDERGSEVDDYTGEVPRVPHGASPHDLDRPQPSGFGDGDVADVDVDVDGDVESGGGGGPGAPAAGTVADEVAEPGDAQPDSPSAETVDVEALIAERDQLKDLAMRLQADFENFRRRTHAQTEGDVDRATGRLAEALLPVLDAAEAAYVNHPDEVGPLLNLMLAELKRHGLETLDLTGRTFDPEIAEAVAHEPGDGGDVVVDEVLRSGYRWRGKTLRAAMVRTRD